MAEKHNFEDLRKPDPTYPKAKYRAAEQGTGDLKSPGYDRIAMIDGVAQRVPDRHSYETRLVTSAKEDKALTAEGWVDHPEEIGKSTQAT